jgi:hypothetical protein
MVTTRKIAARVSGADTGCATTIASIYEKSSELAFRGHGPTAPRDFASKLKDSNPIPARRTCNVDRVSKAKLATRQTAKFDDRFVVDVLGRSALSGRVRT